MWLYNYDNVSISKEKLNKKKIELYKRNQASWFNRKDASDRSLSLNTSCSRYSNLVSAK